MTEAQALAAHVEHLKAKLFSQMQWAFVSTIVLALALVGLEMASPLEQAVSHPPLMHAYFSMPMHTHPVPTGITLTLVLSAYLVVKLFARNGVEP